MSATTEPPAHLQLADEWLATDPAAKCICFSCGKEFPVNGPGGVASVTCPGCGFTPGASACKAALSAMKGRREREAEAGVEAECVPAPTSAPPGLADVIGNAVAVMQIRTALDAHRERLAGGGGKALAFPHLLLAGVGGAGKTMLAEIVARELGRPIRLQMGQSLSNPARVADVLRSLKAGDVLFVDELHGLRPACQEALYRAMEDGILVPVEKAGKPLGKPIKIPPFTLIGATTDEWSLLPSLVQRFKYRVRLERMTAPELARAIADRAERRGWKVTEEAAGMIAARSHGTPRLAVGLLDGCMDMAVAGRDDVVDRIIVEATCGVWGLDTLGLDRVERRYLSILEAAGGGPVRVNVLASQLDNLSRMTVERKIEGTLIWLGLIEKRADGRALTLAGREHLRRSR